MPLFARLAATLALLIYPYASLARTDDTAKVIVAFGDSLTAGYGLKPGEAFPDRLQLWLKGKGIVAKMVNAGVSGDTTTGARSRLDWSLPPGRIDLVIVTLGGNDALRGIDPKLTRANMIAIVKTLKKRRLKVLVGGMMAPPNMGKTYADAFNSIYPDVAKTEGVALYPFFLDGVAGNPRLNQADGMHPNLKGVDIITARIGPKVIATLKGGGKP